GSAQLGLANGRTGRANQRIGIGQTRAEVSIFPRLDAPMRQAEPAISLDGLPPQAGHEGVAGAGEHVGALLEHVEKNLLALGAELLDRQIHVASLPYEASNSAYPTSRS